MNTDKQPSIILGTTSKYRHQLFRQHFPSVPFTHASPSIDEKAIRVGNDQSPRASADPSHLTLVIAHAKADALAQSLNHAAILLTSDQVVVCDGQIREKPLTPEQCRQFLQSYGTGPSALQTVTAVVLTVIPPNSDPTNHSRLDGVDIATQQFDPRISDHVVEQLLAKGDVMYCSGGITIEDPLLKPFLVEPHASIDSIMGLPVKLVRKLFKQAGIEIDQFK